MKKAHQIPTDLRVGDVVTFLCVGRCASIAAAARELRVTPSQVSKAIVRLEAQLRVTLLSRSVRGVGLTDAALRVQPHFEAMLEELRQASALDAPPRRQLTLAAPSYLAALVTPFVAERLTGERLRSVELPPAMLRAYAAENVYDLILIVGEARLPTSWTCVGAGELRWVLVARPPLAERLGPTPCPASRLRGVPFVRPVFFLDRQFVPVDDDCPLGASERTVGYEAQTIAVALEIACRVDALVFSPAVAARRALDEGALVEIPVDGWDVRQPLTLAVSSERVLANEQRRVLDGIARALAETAPTRRPRR